MISRAKRLGKPTETLHLRLEGSLDRVPGLVWHEELDEDGHGEELHGVDLYGIFCSTAVYLGFGRTSGRIGYYGVSSKSARAVRTLLRFEQWKLRKTEIRTNGLWGMNFAGFLQLDPIAIAEFQVGLNSNDAGENMSSDAAIPQFFQCAEISLARFGKFEPKKIELTYAPGEAREMSRLISSLNLFCSYDPTQKVSVRAQLDWHADPNDPELDLELNFTRLHIDPFKVEFENEPSQGKAEANSPLSPFHLTATATMPEFSLNCVGWLVSFLISGLAPTGARDIIVRLELA